ncbi:MAG: RNA 2',3'-cyclic phosphodiesterase [Rhodospirillales bacterium]|nr:RNA 2',3'-cyclic phosphodiesterase [Rhodospirillales bacterium]
MFRLFVALPLPREVREHLAGLCSGIPGARWVPPENMHVTLRFIGEVGGADAEDIHEALDGVRMPAFGLSIAGLGCFESGHKVRSLWAAVKRDELLMRLQDKVEMAVTRSGQTPERRKFKPHVTLARFRSGASVARIGSFMERNNAIALGPFQIPSFALFRSHLGGEGAHYEVLAEYPLRGAGATADLPVQAVP